MYTNITYIIKLIIDYRKCVTKVKQIYFRTINGTNVFERTTTDSKRM